MGKKILLFSLFLLFGLTGYAEVYKNVDSLEPGDWLLIESVEYYPYVAPGVEEEVPWRNENVRRTVLKAMVVERTKEQITFDFQMQHIYSSKNLPDAAYFDYYDNRYVKLTLDAEHYSWVAEKAGVRQRVNTEDILCTITYSLSTGNIISSDVGEEPFYLSFYSRRLPFGIKLNKKTEVFAGGQGVVDLTPVVTESVPLLISMCQQTQKITNPVRQEANPVEGKQVYSPILGAIPQDVSYHLLPRESRIVAASFSLPTNVFLTYVDKQTGEEKEIRFFTPRPCHYPIDRALYLYDSPPWLVYPGDSITLRFDKEGLPVFSGQGGVQNMYQYLENISPLNEESKWKKEKELFPQLNSYWKRAFELSVAYNEASDYLFLSLRDSVIEWKNPRFMALAPMMDYQYLFSSYKRFFDGFLSFKKRDIIMETVSRDSYNTLNMDYKEEYYLWKSLLTGYPRFLMCSESLLDLMGVKMLSQSQEEYEDFMLSCPDEELLEKVKRRHDYLRQLEQNANIRDSDLELAKELLSVKKNKKKYILMNMTPYPGGSDLEIAQVKKIHELLIEKGLDKQVQVCIYRADEPQSYFDEKRQHLMKKLYIYVPVHSIRADMGRTGASTGLTLIMRENGTVLYREFQGHIHDTDYLVDIIAQDLNRSTSSSFWLGFWRGFGFAFLFAVLAVGIIRYRLNFKRKKEEQQRKIKELELKAIRSQMNPHFVFNALGSIQNLINRGDNVKANEYLVQFSRMVRMVLNHSEKKMVALSEEIEQLYLYLNLEQLRFPFTYAVRVDDAIETDLVEIPGMLIQPFVENAVKHGIAPRGEGTIQIDIKQQGKVLQIDITDDGPGLSGQSSDGFGVKAVQEEFQILKELYETEPTITIRDRQAAEQVSGCRVTLAIPIN